MLRTLTGTLRRLQSAFTGQATLSDARHANLDKLLNQANQYSEFLLEQIADIDGKFIVPTQGAQAGAKRKAQPAAKGRAKRRKGAAAEPDPDEDQVRADLPAQTDHVIWPGCCSTAPTGHAGHATCTAHEERARRTEQVQQVQLLPRHGERRLRGSAGPGRGSLQALQQATAGQCCRLCCSPGVNRGGLAVRRTRPGAWGTLEQQLSGCTADHSTCAAWPPCASHVRGCTLNPEPWWLSARRSTS